MPYKNRYVIAALDKNGDSIAFMSPDRQWTDSAESAVCFRSNQDAGDYLKQNHPSQNPNLQLTAPINVNTVQPVFITMSAEQRHQYSIDTRLKDEESAEDVILTGIFG